MERTLRCTFPFIPNIVPGRMQLSRQTDMVTLYYYRPCTSTGSALLHYNLQLHFVEYWNILGVSTCVCSPHVSEAAYYSSTDDCLPSVFERVPVCIRPTNTCPNVIQRVFVLVRILAHVFEGICVRGRILAPCFWEGIRTTDEYLPRVFEMVFVRRRVFALQTEHEANEYEYLFVFVFVRGVEYWHTSLHVCPLELHAFWRQLTAAVGTKKKYEYQVLVRT